MALNTERAAEEARGQIRWLRPEYQNTQGGQHAGLEIAAPEVLKSAAINELSQWPKNLADQAQAVQRSLQRFQRSTSAADINSQFLKVTKDVAKKREKQIGHLLETISSLGLLRKTEDGWYVK